MSFGDPWFYIVLLGAAALIYALMLPAKKDSAKPGRGGSEEVEATLEQYLAEIEKENGELIDLVTQMKQDFAAKQLSQQEQLVELRKRLNDVELASRENHVKLGELEETSKANSAKEPVSGAPAVTAVDAAVKPDQSPPVIELPEIVNQVQESDPAVDAEGDSEIAGTTVRERYPDLFDLYDKGKSLDMIAKTVGIQRGEVQLILQLAKKEDSR